MKVAELFEVRYGIDRVTGGKVELKMPGQPANVKMSASLTKTGGPEDTRIDTRTGTLSKEPSEAEETKLGHELVYQIEQPLYIQEQPFPADPKMYMVASNEDLKEWKIIGQQAINGHENIIRGGSVWVIDPKDITGKPQRISWKNHFVERDPYGMIALGIERNSAEQARVLQQLDSIDIQ